MGHVDIVWTRDDGVKIPVEIKTTNSKFIDGPSFLHRKQLLQYAAIPDVPYGKLIYIFLDNKTENPFQEFLVTFEDDERAEILEKLEYDAVELSSRILAQDPSLVSYVANNPNFMGYNGKNWLCEKCCAYKNQCDAMRISAGEQIKAPDVKAKSKSIDSLITEIKCRQQ